MPYQIYTLCNHYKSTNMFIKSRNVYFIGEHKGKLNLKTHKWSNINENITQRNKVGEMKWTCRIFSQNRNGNVSSKDTAFNI